MKKNLRLSVHQLVDFLLRRGDIDNRVFNRSSMNEGSKIHASYQSMQDKDYISEYPLKHDFVSDEIVITLEGRADGVIKRGPDEYVIDEIKSTVQDLKEFRDGNLDWHLGQAKCYALMFALESNLSSIGVKLTYIRQGKEKEKLIENYTFMTENLNQYVHCLIDDYLAFYNLIFRYQEKRDASIKDLTFPFEKFRNGQRQLAKYCYATAKNGGVFFAEAPTGIGKTMSTLFPFVKSLPNDDKSKIFYLTAKTSGKESAYNACEIMKSKGLDLTDIIITAKEKICLMKGRSCNPDECPYARGYYDKIQSVIKYSLLNYSSFRLENILQIAKENEVCPFEYELDLSLFCDLIICDYNYMFDPISYFKRYFDEDSSHFLALVDEAHNLVDRSRDMFSATLSYSKFSLARKSLRKVKHPKLKREISKQRKMYEDIMAVLPFGNSTVDDFTEEQYKALNSFVNLMQDLNKNEHEIVSEELLDYYLDVNRFLKISELYSERYLSYVSKDEEELVLHQFCMDPSIYLSKMMHRIKSTVLFSATLSPLDYFVDILGGRKELDPRLVLSSPFPKENLKLMIAPKVSVKYKNREASYDEVASYIESFISVKKGNYFIYVPSYDYLEHFLTYIHLEDVDLFIQERDMSDLEREEFLLNFKPTPEKTTVGLLVLGGAFSEGVDLVSDRLIGAAIIGIGMPKLNFESDSVAEHYSAKGYSGRDYAYINPGMNKVQQAVGRVIRSEYDFGAVLLIDERYMSSQYRNLFREEWGNYDVVLSPKEVKETLTDFFRS